MIAMSNSPYSLRLDAKIRKRLEAEAKRQKRSAAFVVHEALEAYLNSRDYERKIADEAFAEAEKGVFVSGEKVHAWMEAVMNGEVLPFPEPDIFSEPQETRRLLARKAG
jgi:predicted transcriptional regulator